MTRHTLLQILPLLAPSILPSRLAAATDETQPAPPAHTVPAIQIIGLDQDHSEELLRAFFGKIAENRLKLKTIHVKAETSIEEFNADKKTWRETNYSKGEGWVEAADPQRGRDEIALFRAEWPGGPEPFYEFSYTEVWDGHTVIRLEQVKGDPQPALSSHDGPWYDEMVNARGSTQLLWDCGTQDGKTIPHFSPEALKDKILHVRRVILKGNILAWEFTEEYPPAPDGKEPPEGHSVIKFWFDDARSMVLLGMEMTSGEHLHHRMAAIEIAEGAPGIFWPKETRNISYKPDGTPRSYQTFTASTVELNAPIPEEKFNVALPSNAK